MQTEPLQSQFDSEAFAPLTATGPTAASGPFEFAPTHHTVQAVVTGAPTAVSAQLQGSLDGTDFFNVGTAQSVPSGGIFSIPDFPLLWVRVQLATLTGGTSPTVTFSYLGVRA